MNISFKFLLVSALLVSISLNIYLIFVESKYPLFNDAGRNDTTQTGRFPNDVKQEGQAYEQGLAVDNKTSAQINMDNAAEITAIRELFQAGEYFQAFKGLRAIAVTADRKLANQIKAEWLEVATDWIVNDPQAPHITQFFDAALAVLPRDLEIRQLLAELHAARGNVEAAIDQLYELLPEVDASLQGVFVSRVMQWVKKQVAFLSSNQAWKPLADFAERLLWHEPSHPPYLMIYARALFQLERFSEARSNLLLLQNHEFYAAQAKQLLDKIRRLELADMAVALQKSGAHYIVRGQLNQAYPVKLMIDTGATFSVISAQALAQFQLSPAPKFVRNADINTAGGLVNAPVYRINSFSIGDYEVNDIEFVVMDVNTGGGSVGLLGMNFLSQFSFQIDQQNSMLMLSPPGL